VLAEEYTAHLFRHNSTTAEHQVLYPGIVGVRASDSLLLWLAAPSGCDHHSGRSPRQVHSVTRRSGPD
jgi:hypothetical protein